MRNGLMLLAALLVAGLTSRALARPPKSAESTPLDEYVREPDPVYDWEVVSTAGDNRSQTTVIKLT